MARRLRRQITFFPAGGTSVLRNQDAIVKVRGPAYCRLRAAAPDRHGYSCVPLLASGPCRLNRAPQPVIVAVAAPEASMIQASLRPVFVREREGGERERERRREGAGGSEGEGGRGRVCLISVQQAPARHLRLSWRAKLVTVCMWVRATRSSRPARRTRRGSPSPGGRSWRNAP